MKLGFNMLLWTPHVTAAHEKILRDLKKTGYGGVEIPMFEGDPDHYARLGEMLDEIGLERTVVSILGPGKNCLSPDKAQQQAAAAHAKWAIDCSAALGAAIIAGPMHSELGYFSGAPATTAERKRGVSFHRKAGDYAARKNVRFAVEALNRFECYALNTCERADKLVRAVNRPNYGYLFDTFHSNIEEKDTIAALKSTLPSVTHIHISENDRGTPGRGHAPIVEAIRTARTAGYKGWLTVEAFGHALPDIAAATRVWRPLFGSYEEVTTEAITLIRHALEEA